MLTTAYRVTRKSSLYSPAVVLLVRGRSRERIGQLAHFDSRMLVTLVSQSEDWFARSLLRYTVELFPIRKIVINSVVSAVVIMHVT